MRGRVKTGTLAGIVAASLVGAGFLAYRIMQQAKQKRATQELVDPSPKKETPEQAQENKAPEEQTPADRASKEQDQEKKSPASQDRENETPEEQTPQRKASHNEVIPGTPGYVKEKYDERRKAEAAERKARLEKMYPVPKIDKPATTKQESPGNKQVLDNQEPRRASRRVPTNAPRIVYTTSSEAPRSTKKSPQRTGLQPSRTNKSGNTLRAEVNRWLESLVRRYLEDNFDLNVKEAADMATKLIGNRKALNDTRIEILKNQRATTKGGEQQSTKEKNEKQNKKKKGRPNKKRNWSPPDLNGEQITALVCKVTGYPNSEKLTAAIKSQIESLREKQNPTEKILAGSESDRPSSPVIRQPQQQQEQQELV